MLINKLKKLFAVTFCVLMTFSSFAASTTDLSVRFLDKANEAFEDGNVEEAYKYVNQALAVSRDDALKANTVYFAKEIYAVKLERILEKYDELAFIDIQTNLERYPEVENAKIKKLIRQIDSKTLSKEKAEAKAEAEAQKKLQAEQFEQQMDVYNQQAAVLKDFTESSKQDQAELKEALNFGFQNVGKVLTDSAEETKRSTKVIAISVIGIAVIILIIIMLIVIIVRKGFKQQQIQQAQYVQAFKMLAASQNQTNRIMLGGITDLYGTNPAMRIAGSSTWAPAEALPDLSITEEDEEELKQLAIKCEELGSKVDAVTGRKNNSKNVSETVYKLSMALGLPQGMAMLNFCAAMVYDSGFLGIDPELLKKDVLDEEQKKALNEHINLSEKYFDFVPKKYWSVFEDAAMKHHENIDGTGYPEGLKGEEIPQIARLIRVAETYVSLSSKRNYRQTMDKETAIQILRDQPGLYDSMVVDALDQIV